MDLWQHPFATGWEGLEPSERVVSFFPGEIYGSIRTHIV